MSDLAPEPERRGTAWSSKPPVNLADLDDKRLTDYRHPDEKQALAMIAIGFVVILIGLWFARPSVAELLRWLPSPLLRAVVDALHPARLGPIIVLGLAVATLIDAIGLSLKRYDLPYGAVEVNPVTFPQLGPVVEELSRRFDMPETRAFATRVAPFEGNAMGVREPYMIVFSTALLSSLTIDEFKFLLGRQMGHVKLGHTRLAVVFGGSVPLSFAWLRKLRTFVFGNYLRAQELSADRIGLLATRDLRPVLTFLTKFEIGTVRGAKIDLESLEPRAAELQGGRNATVARLRQLLASQPRFVFRVLELTQWAGLPPPPAPSASAAAAAPPPTDSAAVTGPATSVPAAPGGPAAQAGAPAVTGAVVPAADSSPGTTSGAPPATATGPQDGAATATPGSVVPGEASSDPLPSADQGPAAPGAAQAQSASPQQSPSS